MDRRALLERLAAMATAAGLAGCTNLSGNDESDTTAESRTATAAAETRTETASERSTTTNDPPDIPRPGTPPMATTTAGRTTTEDEPPDIPPPGTPPSATTTGTTDDGPPDIPAPGTPPAPTKTPAFSVQCSLSHTVVGSGENLTPSGGPVLRYEDLSSAAKRVVKRAVTANETVSIPYDSRQRPPEFAYSDENHSYDIEYRGTTYRLFTATGMGCPVLTATE